MPPEEPLRHEQTMKHLEEPSHVSATSRRGAAARPPIGRDSPRCSQPGSFRTAPSRIAPVAQAFLEVFSRAPKLSGAFGEAGLRTTCQGPCSRSGGPQRPAELGGQAPNAPWVDRLWPRVVCSLWSPSLTGSPGPNRPRRPQLRVDELRERSRRSVLAAADALQSGVRVGWRSVVRRSARELARFRRGSLCAVRFVCPQQPELATLLRVDELRRSLCAVEAV